MRTAWIGPVRAVVLLALALAMVADLTSFAVLVGRDAEPSRTPGRVAVEVVRSVADADCDDLSPLLDPEADLPYAVERCLRGEGGAVPYDDVSVVSTTQDGDSATVVVEVRSGGSGARLEALLGRDGDRWLVSSLLPVG